MPALIIGRILGGLSTSLLFSAFESWMVSEHRKRGFPEELLASTFAIASWGNGIVAIAAGFLAQLSADYAGDIGPFQLAIVLTAVTLLLIMPWRENYGHADGVDSQKESVYSISASIASSVNVIIHSPVMVCLGLSQAFFEGAIYTFGEISLLISINNGFILRASLASSSITLISHCVS
jgi:MFS transporter, MFS domain-containing protein family, molybdate-anion transporter